MFVSATLEGRVVIAPDLRKTGKKVPVSNFTVATGQTTWVVAAWSDLAYEVLDKVHEGDHVCVAGTLASSGQFTGADGQTRTRIEVRAQAVALNPAPVAVDLDLTLRGTVATVPDAYEDQGQQVLEVDVRTSRLRRGGDGEADVTYWPVTVAGPELIAHASTWTVGEPVVVVGQARPLSGTEPDVPQVEVWARSVGRDLYPQDLPPTTGQPRTSARRGQTRG